jgi:hypothetical protein
MGVLNEKRCKQTINTGDTDEDGKDYILIVLLTG